MSYIPVVDFECFHVDNASSVDISNDKVQETSRKLCDALRTIGFVYLKNHGIRDEEITRLKELYDGFFNLPADVKQKYTLDTKDGFGYFPYEWEKCNPSRPHGDLKEAFNVIPTKTKLYPNAKVPGIEDGTKLFFNRACVVARRLLQAIAIGLKLEDPNFFDDYHHVNNPSISNMSTVRVLRYPPLDGTEIKPGQVRCGEHSDFGSVTLVFQDEVGGLEVRGLDGEYKPATPIPGTAVVNIGDLMQRWTADQLKSTKHRVMVPLDEEARKRARSSVVFFMVADDDAVIECIDGSGKYPPSTSKEWVMSEMYKTYQEL